MKRKIHKLQSMLLVFPKVTLLVFPRVTLLVFPRVTLFERVLVRCATYYLLLVISLRGMEHGDDSLPRSVPPSYGQERTSLSQAGERGQHKEGKEGKMHVAFCPEVAGELLPVSGSPFPAAQGPFSVTYSPTGLFCAVANGGSNDISVYQVGGADKERIALLTSFLVDRSPDLPASYLDRLPGEVRVHYLLPYLLGHRTY
jgi:hypothetical protein